MLLKSSIVTTLSGIAAAKLIVPRSFPAAEALLQQIAVPILSNASDSTTFTAGQYTRTQQSDDICANNGKKQWTGTVDVSNQRRLFYWFFDSQSDPKNDPVIIWLNGGPGSSSMFGLMTEMGPCTLLRGSSSTKPNPWAWNKKANLLFIDQPAGVGFSQLAPGAALPNADQDGAEDFQAFLKTFFANAFPEKAHLPIHLAAESYGGHYAPTYLAHILSSRRGNPSDAFRGNIKTMLLINSIVDFTAPYLGQYNLFCAENAVGRGILNKTDCKAMERSYPTCMGLRESCNLGLQQKDCSEAVSYCSSTINKYYSALLATGERDPYDIRVKCPGLPQCDDEKAPNITTFFNLPRVKSALQFSSNYTFLETNTEINHEYFTHNTTFLPTLTSIGAIIDAHLQSERDDIRLLVINGKDDYIVNTPGNILAYDDLRWSEQAEYRFRPWLSLPGDVSPSTGSWKGTRSGRLVFVAVDGAGHMVPHDQREGSYKIMQKWLDGGWKSK